MLYAPHDLPTIRHSILKRLGAERGVTICDVIIKERKDHVRVAILALLDGFDALRVTSCFELPKEFELIQVHNEIDQIAEQYKAARLDYWAKGRPELGRMESIPLAGTGLRGLWPA